jgi:hypothetical protein
MDVESCIKKGCARKIYYFAQASMYATVIDLLRNEKPVHIAWKQISDPKEPRDGDAYFYTGEEHA